MTSDVDWDPTTYDNVILDINKFYDASVDEVHHSNFDDHGNYHHCTVATHTLYAIPNYFDVHEYPDFSDVVDNILDAHNPELVRTIYGVQAVESSPTSERVNVIIL
jgi:hypothetical protein